MFCQIQKMIKEQGTTPKRKGVVLLEAVFALLLMGMVTYGFAETSAMAFSQQSALKNSDKARQYADLEAEVLKSNGFENLETTGVHDRKTLQPITGQNDGYESTVTLASTVAVTPENSVKVAKIDVFKTGENTPRYSLEVPLSSQSGSGDSLPKGTILPYTGLLSDIPAGWHLCDGTDGTPNLIGQFLQGSNIPGSFIDAALPNITGFFSMYNGEIISYGGAFSFHHNSSTASSGSIISGSGGAFFNAANSSIVYKDDCNTVQPPAYTVYYIIKVS